MTVIIWFCEECGEIDQHDLEERGACPECGRVHYLDCIEYPEEEEE
jgi:rubrerythrin|tara:strand:- start:414 stop:551 length:138 start_codon:yes stop_codon:yes gene_type:complete